MPPTFPDIRAVIRAFLPLINHGRQVMVAGAAVKLPLRFGMYGDTIEEGDKPMTDMTQLKTGPARLRMMDESRIWCTVLGLGAAFHTVNVRLANGTPATFSYSDIRYAIQAA